MLQTENDEVKRKLHELLDNVTIKMSSVVSLGMYAHAEPCDKTVPIDITSIKSYVRLIEKFQNEIFDKLMLLKDSRYRYYAFGVHYYMLQPHQRAEIKEQIKNAFQNVKENYKNAEATFEAPEVAEFMKKIKNIRDQVEADISEFTAKSKKGELSSTNEANRAEIAEIKKNLLNKINASGAELLNLINNDKVKNTMDAVKGFINNLYQTQEKLAMDLLLSFA